MKTITFTNEEIRALKELTSNSNNCCSGGCVYKKMQKSKIECSSCDFMTSVNSIENKLYQKEKQ